MTVATTPFRRPYDNAHIFNGWSNQSKSIADQVIAANVRFEEAASNQPLILALEQLLTIFAEYSTENWDGFGALPLSKEAMLEAGLFLQYLDDARLPMPYISPEVDGGIELEWYKSTDFIFTVNMSGNEILGYSGFYGKRKRTYGTEPLTKEIPASIAGNIAQFI